MIQWRKYARGPKLNRNEIAKKTGIARSTMNNNPLIKADLADLEDSLRQGLNPVLQPLKENPGQSYQIKKLVTKVSREEKRMSKVETENAILRAERDELRKENKQLHEIIEKNNFTVIYQEI
jgi:chromosome condensin MukBEF ATPase and DNA-binding subunit MukB